jgi:aspartate racemase
LMYSVDFGNIAALQHDGKWDELALMMIDAAQRLERGGAECIVLCTNTMHKLAEHIESNINIPFLHIGDATAQAVKKQGLKKVGLLGTKFTMEQGFLKNRFSQNHDIQVIIPNEADRNTVHQIIYEELVKGIISETSREEYLKIIEKLMKEGAEGIVLGCTEIELLVSSKYTDATLFATTQIHAEAAVAFALN